MQINTSNKTDSASKSADAAQKLLIKFIRKADLDHLLELSRLLLKSGNDAELRNVLNKEISKRP